MIRYLIHGSVMDKFLSLTLHHEDTNVASGSI